MTALRWPECSPSRPGISSASTHIVNHHHIWVLKGRATILGDELGPGLYVHVPRGVAHDIDATKTDGCTVFYLYAHPGS